MFKKLLACVISLGVASFISAGCAAPPTPMGGSLILDVHAPNSNGGQAIVGQTNDSISATKTGSAMISSLLGWITDGDCSVNAACAVEQITKVSHVDYHSTSLLGLIADHTTIVYGE